MTRGCPFIAAAARQTAEPGGDSASLLSATSLDEALHVVHGPHGPLPLHATASCAPEVSSLVASGCPFLAAQARRAQASEASVEECAAPAPECAPGQGRGCSAAALEHDALRRLAAAPFARIAFPPPGFGTTPLTPVRAPGGELHWSAALRAGNKDDGLLRQSVVLLSPPATPTVPPTAVWRDAGALQLQGSATDTTASSTEQRGGAFPRGVPPAVPLTRLTLHRQAARAPCAACPASSAS